MTAAPKSVTVVPIGEVKIPANHQPSHSAIRRFKEVLRRQGLIEPICIRANWDCWHVGYSELLLAARELNWPTVIVVNAHPDSSS